MEQGYDSPATCWDEELVIALHGAITHLHHPVSRVYTHHLQHIRKTWRMQSHLNLLHIPHRKDTFYGIVRQHHIQWTCFPASHLLLRPHFYPILLIKVSWPEKDAAAVQIQSLKEAMLLIREWLCDHQLDTKTSYLTEFGLIKWRKGVFGYDDNATLIAVLPKRLSTNQRGRTLNTNTYNMI